MKHPWKLWNIHETLIKTINHNKNKNIKKALAQRVFLFCSQREAAHWNVCIEFAWNLLKHWTYSLGLNVFGIAFVQAVRTLFNNKLSLARTALESTFIRAALENCAFSHSTANSFEHKEKGLKEKLRVKRASNIKALKLLADEKRVTLKC